LLFKIPTIKRILKLPEKKLPPPVKEQPIIIHPASHLNPKKLSKKQFVETIK